MRIHLRSDVHLHVNRQFVQPSFPKDADVYVIAGDIEDHRYPSKVAEDNPDKHVVVVLGNHDYWYADGPDQYRDPSLPNLHVLEKESVEINGYRFLGCCLWGKGPDNNYEARTMVEGLNDFYKIPSLKRDPFVMRDWNRESVHWLEQQLAVGDLSKTVVVTHFPPLSTSDEPDSLTYLYYNGGVPEELVYKPALWLYGHTHDVKHNRDAPISNALGYVKYKRHEGAEFDPQFVVEI